MIYSYIRSNIKNLYYILISNAAFYIQSESCLFLCLVFFPPSMVTAPHSFLQLNSFPLCEYALTVSNWKDLGVFLSFDIIYNVAMNNAVCKSLHMDASVFTGHIADLHLMNKGIHASVILTEFTNLPPQ